MVSTNYTPFSDLLLVPLLSDHITLHKKQSCLDVLCRKLSWKMLYNSQEKHAMGLISSEVSDLGLEDY